MIKLSKRIVSLGLILVCLFSFIGCSNKNNNSDGGNSNNDTTIQDGSTNTVVEQTIYNIEYYIDKNLYTTQKIVAGENAPKPTNPTKAGYTFLGWYKDELLTNEFDFDSEITKNRKLYSKWQIDENAIGDLPVVYINTQDGVFPQDKKNYINCSFEIQNCENEEYNMSVEMTSKSDLEADPSVKQNCGVRLRGNSTSSFAKKPFRIKFDAKKKSLFGLTAAKSWVLLADYMDQSSIRNYSAFNFAGILDETSYTPSANHVVLYFNGEYMGLYLLTEQVDEKEGRNNVEAEEHMLAATSETKDFAFQIEFDRCALTEGTTGVDNFATTFQPVEIKYPEYDERNIPEGSEDYVFNYIQEYVNAVLHLLEYGGTTTVSFEDEPVKLEDLLDVDSFIDYCLINELMFNQDNTWGSICASKKVGEPMKFGPVWDFDWSCSDTYTGKPYTNAFNHCATDFVSFKFNTPYHDFALNEEHFEDICERWNEISADVESFVQTYLYDYKFYLNDAAKYDANYWYGETGSFQYQMQYDYVRLFLLDRIEFFNSVFVSGNFEEFRKMI